MSKKIWLYVIFFLLLLTGFYFMLPKEILFQSKLPVLNAGVQPFSFTDQNGKPFTEKNVEGKVYVTEYFFTTCKGICPIMNANMRRVYDTYKNEQEFMIVSHTCMPETDSVPLLKDYEIKMINSKLVKNTDGSYKFELDSAGIFNNTPANSNWFFLTGNKTNLYKMARESYLIDNNKPDSMQNIADQFIHTQFFALVDKYQRVRGIYDGLNEGRNTKTVKRYKRITERKSNQ